MPLSQQIIDQIKANRENGLRSPEVEMLRMERKISALQQMVIKQMQINQDTLLKVVELERENTEMKKDLSIMARQIDFKERQALRALK